MIRRQPGKRHLLVSQESEIVAEYQPASVATSWLCLQHQYSRCADWWPWHPDWDIRKGSLKTERRFPFIFLFFWNEYFFIKKRKKKESIKKEKLKCKDKSWKIETRSWNEKWTGSPCSRKHLDKERACPLSWCFGGLLRFPSKERVENECLRGHFLHTRNPLLFTSP